MAAGAGTVASLVGLQIEVQTMRPASQSAWPMAGKHAQDCPVKFFGSGSLIDLNVDPESWIKFRIINDIHETGHHSPP